MGANGGKLLPTVRERSEVQPRQTTDASVQGPSPSDMGANGGSCSRLYGAKRSTAATNDRRLVCGPSPSDMGANGGSCSRPYGAKRSTAATNDRRLVQGPAHQTWVRTEGVEPSRELPRQNLNLVRLPIPPRSRVEGLDIPPLAARQARGPNRKLFGTPAVPLPCLPDPAIPIRNARATGSILRKAHLHGMAKQHLSATEVERGIARGNRPVDAVAGFPSGDPRALPRVLRRRSHPRARGHREPP